MVRFPQEFESEMHRTTVRATIDAQQRDRKTISLWLLFGHWRHSSGLNRAHSLRSFREKRTTSYQQKQFVVFGHKIAPVTNTKHNRNPKLGVSRLSSHVLSLHCVGIRLWKPIDSPTASFLKSRIETFKNLQKSSHLNSHRPKRKNGRRSRRKARDWR